MVAPTVCTFTAALVAVTGPPCETGVRFGTVLGLGAGFGSGSGSGVGVGSGVGSSGDE